MNDLKLPNLWTSCDSLLRQAELFNELGADTEVINNHLKRVEEFLAEQFKQIEELKIDQVLKVNEPDRLEDIKKLRPLSNILSLSCLPKDYDDRLAGAFYARSAGCTLGTIVEGWGPKDMKLWAKHCGVPFPPLSYFPMNCNVPDQQRCGVSKYVHYTPSQMEGIPCDDDLTYTILGLLALEECGINLNVEDIGRLWLKYVPSACTAEAVALDNLKKGIEIRKCADVNNPYKLWIGAMIRSDAWGWVCPGDPEKAASFAYEDAMLTHRRTGVYGEMLFAAAQAAAFVADDSLDAIRVGLNQIPKDCQFADAVKWALNESNRISDYEQARAAVDQKFRGMNSVHTINNACLVIFGLSIGNNNISKTLSQTVAMGLDNDCTTATAGSIVGAVVGKSKMENHWIEPLGDTINTYLIGQEKFNIDDVLARFKKQAELIIADGGWHT